MKKCMKVFNKSLLLTSFITLVACSPKPHVGESVTTVDSGDGVKVTHREDRYLLDSGKIGGEESALIQARAVVENIDYKGRVLTIRTEDGKSATLKVADDVVNFKQIKIGDQVAVDYYISVAFEARKPTPSEISSSDKALEIAANAAKGKKPAMLAIEEGIRVVTVDKVNKDKQLLVLRASDGSLTTVKAKYPENLSYIKTGDQIVLKITEALAAQVSKVQ